MALRILGSSVAEAISSSEICGYSSARPVRTTAGIPVGSSGFGGLAFRNWRANRTLVGST